MFYFPGINKPKHLHFPCGSHFLVMFEVTVHYYMLLLHFVTDSDFSCSCFSLHICTSKLCNLVLIIFLCMFLINWLCSYSFFSFYYFYFNELIFQRPRFFLIYVYIYMCFLSIRFVHITKVGSHPQRLSFSRSAMHLNKHHNWF